MATRIEQQNEESLITTVSDLEDVIRELKTGVQYVEAQMIDSSTASSYDMTGTWTGPTTSLNQNLFQLSVTATSVDGKPFLSSFFAELWFNSFSGGAYHDTLISPYGVISNKIITDDPTVTRYWVSAYARTIGTAAGTFWMKAHVYASAPVTVAFTRDL